MSICRIYFNLIQFDPQFIPIDYSICVHSYPNNPSAGYTSLKTAWALKNPPVVNVVSISKSSRTVCQSVEFNHYTRTYTNSFPYLRTNPSPSWSLKPAASQSTVASGEIGLLFYFRKQFASVIKSFRATPAILGSRPSQMRSKPPFPSVGFPFLATENVRDAPTTMRDRSYIWIADFSTHLA